MSKVTKKKILQHFVYLWRECCFKNRELFTSETTIPEMIKILNQTKYNSLLIGTLPEKNNTKLISWIIEAFDNNEWLKDFEIADGVFRQIKYEPFTCKFKTTGKIIVENDLRHFYEEKEFDVNSIKGIVQTIEHYSNQEMLHGFVGNSCPTLYISPDKDMIHVGAQYDHKDDKLILPEGYTELAWVCTDLWWYSIADYETFMKENPNACDEDFTIVEIPAGTWELEHKYGISVRGYHEQLPYATLKLINKSN